nr:YjbF family lipoprotein [uncultured Rhodoferax sp.]
MNLRDLVLICCIPVVLGACAGDSVLRDVTSAVYANSTGKTEDHTLNLPLVASDHYLRIHLKGGQPTILVLGYEDHHLQGLVEVWYSAAGEVLKIQNGRIVGTAGLTSNWQQVDISNAPSKWSGIGAGVQWMRTRDESPGYKYGIFDTLVVSEWQGLPPQPISSTLPLSVAKTYRWYTELPSDGQSSKLPAAWFAVSSQNGIETVEYSEQCITPDLCFSLQRWPLKEIHP